MVESFCEMLAVSESIPCQGQNTENRLICFLCVLSIRQGNRKKRRPTWLICFFLKVPSAADDMPV